MQTSEILNKAADLIETRGWADKDNPSMWGGGATGSGPLCLEGGILAAQGKGEFPHAQEAFIGSCPAYRAVHEYLLSSGQLRAKRARVYEFNDAPGRTASEVIEVLRAAAVIEQARETEPAKVAA